MWGLLEKGKELAAKMENQLNEAAGIEGQLAAAASAGGDDALNDAWNDDFDDDDVFETTEKKVSEPPSVPPIIEEDDGGGGTAWGDDVNFDDALQDVQEKALPAPIRSDSIKSQLDDYPAENFVENPVAAEPPSSHHVEDPVVDYYDPVVVSDDAPQEQPEPQLLAGEPETIEEQPTAAEEEPLTPHPTPEDPMEEEVDALTPETENTVVVEQPEDFHSKESTPVVVEKQDAAGWEQDLYDDNDDEDDEEEEEEEDQSPETFNRSAEAPPATITIPAPSNGGISAAETEELRQHYEMELAQLKSQVLQTQTQLHQREDQIAHKAEQMAAMVAMHEAEKEDLRTKIKETKEEAKRRIIKAKERIDAMEASMKSGGSAEDLVAKDETINALREEGQKLANKQSQMEKAVRSALSESRDLMASLDEEVAKKEKGLDRIGALETDLKKTKDELNAARRGESAATKLENELQSLKEEADRKEAANMSLQQQLKELKAENKELRKDMEAMEKGNMVESKRESHKLKKEHGDLLSEMEVKLRAAEREASVREDALRTEVMELRKRWQDAVRRADALSMDVQSSTAPLLRQLESMERQNRVRAAAWAELETKLRTDLEDHIIESEKLTKERNEYKSSSNRLSRVSKERDDELSACKNTIEDQKSRVVKQEALIEEMETEGRKMKEEWSEVERLANEGVSKVRSDMMTTVLESEERHQAQLKSIENELKEEQKKRDLLQRQVENMLENAGMVAVPTPSSNAANAAVAPKSVQKKLRLAQSQGSILSDAISGLNNDDDGGGEDADDDDDFDDTEQGQPPQGGGMSSFAAMEQLSQRLKEAKVELEALRQSLASSERVRESLLQELSETRVAKEKLPLFEAKVQELAVENREKTIEIMSLTEDVAEIRQLYRGQLNTLIEEKAATMSKAASAQFHDPSDVFMTPMRGSPAPPEPALSNGTFYPPEPLQPETPVAAAGAPPFEPSKMD
jgi:chromosome segregation ATPase